MTELLPDASAISERFNPTTMRGEMIEAEHVARYRWAGRLARGRRVLDAGCGTAYGSRLLAEAGATEVIGVDRADEILEQARSSMPENVTLLAGDVAELEFEDKRFDLVVCFGLIEDVLEPGRALDEFRRVLAPSGLLAISSPNRVVHREGNPRHLHEYTPHELNEALSERFHCVRLERQQSWIASAVLDDKRYALGEDCELGADLSVRKLVSDSPGREPYTLALAGAHPFPAGAIVFELASPVELRRWDEVWHEQDAMLREQDETLAEQDAMLREQAQTLSEQEGLLREQTQTLSEQDAMLRSQAKSLSAQARHFSDQERELGRQVREASQLRARLSESEAELAGLLELEARVGELLAINQELLDRQVDQAEIERLRATSDRYAVVVQSRSWRITRPLRRSGAMLRKLVR